VPTTAARQQGSCDTVARFAGAVPTRPSVPSPDPENKWRKRPVRCDPPLRSSPPPPHAPAFTVAVPDRSGPPPSAAFVSPRSPSHRPDPPRVSVFRPSVYGSARCLPAGRVRPVKRPRSFTPHATARFAFTRPDPHPQKRFRPCSPTPSPRPPPSVPPRSTVVRPRPVARPLRVRAVPFPPPHRPSSPFR